MNHLILNNFPDAEIKRNWEHFLAISDFAADYTSWQFFEDPLVLENRKFAVLAIDSNKQVHGSLTGVFSGKRLVSGLPNRPQIALDRTGGRLQAVSALSDGLLELAKDNCSFIEVHSFYPIKEFEQLGFKSSSNELGDIVVLDLELPIDEIFKGFSQTRRNEIRKAEKVGALEISELQTEGELCELYKIHKSWCLKKGITADAFENFSSFLIRKNERKVFVAKLDGKVIAGSYYRFYAGGVIEYAGNNSIPEFQKYRPNDLIGWHSIQWAKSAGFKLYSMGGAHLFLRRFGGETVRSTRYTKDISLFGINTKKEAIQNYGIRLYQSIPLSIRKRGAFLRGK
ncbi:MAG: GNAT family N-acetyltransferase [Pyrinomonadaceae bacterium]